MREESWLGHLLGGIAATKISVGRGDIPAVLGGGCSQRVGDCVKEEGGAACFWAINSVGTAARGVAFLSLSAQICHVERCNG